MDVNYKPDSATIRVEPKEVLTELSFGIESVANNFLGRGVYRFEFTRYKGDRGECLVTAKALCPSGPPRLSQVSQLGMAVKEGIIPRDIPLSDQFQKSILVAQDGQNVVGGWTESIVENEYVRPDLQMCVISYGLSDLVTGLFALGVNHVKWQGSLRRIQTYIRHKMDQERLLRYIREQGNGDYDINMKVEKLS